MMMQKNQSQQLTEVELIEEEQPENAMKKAPYSDYDGAWKQILDEYSPAFMEFFFPDAYQEIDWSRGYEVLDQELHKIAPSAKTHMRLTDKLVKVWRIDGTEHWVLIHIEVQSQKEVGFEKRVYVYFYRIRDLHDIPVATFVVLGDTTKEWKPSKYEEELWGTKLSFEYPVVKLRDYWKRWDELEQSKNPFATVVMAHLQTQKSYNKPQMRFDIKLNLTRRLYKLGYNREEVSKLFRFIDWVMWLPEELEPDFWDEVTQIQEDKGMEYISTGERVGYRRGRLESRLEMLMFLASHLLKPDDEGLKKIQSRMALIEKESDVDRLANLLVMQPTLNSFMNYLPKLEVEMAPS